MGTVHESLIDNLLIDWQTAISDTNFCGTDVSLEASFESLRLEVDKDTSLHGGVATDWEVVLRIASDIIGTQSKDIWALTYSIRAAYELEGIAGCCKALTEANKLWIPHWPEMFPPVSRKQRRCAPFAWLCSKLETLISSEAFPHIQVDLLGNLKKELVDLQAMLHDNLQEDAPSLSAIIHAIPGVDTQEEEQSQTHTAVPPPLQVKQQAVPPSSMLSPAEMLKVTDSEGRIPTAALPHMLRNVQEQNQQLAVHYLASDMTDWRAYLLHRTGTWATIGQLPQANTEGVTQLRPIPRDRALAYKAAIESKQYMLTLPQLERSAGKAPFWFDGHHMVAQCLAALEANSACDVLCFMLTQLVTRFPELPMLKFHDGTPFASEKTQEWIADLLQKPQKGADAAQWAGGSLKETTQSSDQHEALLVQALDTLRKENFEAGLAILGHTPASRSRVAIQHGLLKARYCFAAGKPKAASYLLLALYEQLTEWNLLEWEPELSATIVSLLCATKQIPASEFPKDVIRLLHWLHLDTALRVIKE